MIVRFAVPQPEGFPHCFSLLSLCGERKALEPGYNHWKINRSIETNQCQLVSWYRLVSVNRWSINSHIKLSANYIDFQSISDTYWLLITFSKKIDEKSQNPVSLIAHRFLINQLIVIDWFQLVLILIDWQIHRLHMPGIFFLSLELLELFESFQILKQWPNFVYPGPRGFLSWQRDETREKEVVRENLWLRAMRISLSCYDRCHKNRLTSNR